MEKIIIVGGGIAGLSAGIYGQQAGFETVVIDNNAMPGGECTGWNRKGFHIDGCIHWLTGTNKETELYKVWENLGGLGSVDIHQFEYIHAADIDGETVKLYRDKEKMKEYFLQISPSDKENIEELYKIICAFENFDMPVEMPVDMMSLSQLVKFLRKMKPVGKYMKSLQKVSASEYVAKFKSSKIRGLLELVLPAYCNAVSLFATLSAFTSGNGGVPYGGSLQMSKRIADRYIHLGGTLMLNQEVVEIIINNNTATGVKLKNGEIISGQYIVSACDAKMTFEHLLKGKYSIKAFEERYNNPDKYPTSSSVFVALGVDKELSDLPHSFVFPCEAFNVAHQTIDKVGFRNYNFEKSFAPAGRGILIVNIMQGGDEYHFWEKLYKDKTAYDDYKQKLGQIIADRIEKRYPELKDKITVLDVATPITYNQYCKTYKGALMSFALTKDSKQMMSKGKIKGLKHFCITGQWTMPPGGLPTAAVTGKWTIQRICKELR